MCSGDNLMINIIEMMNIREFSPSTRRTMYTLLIPLFSECDFFSPRDCMGEDECFDKVLVKLYPEEFTER